MNAQELENFVDFLADVPDYFREHIKRAHAGDCALWQARELRRVDNAIVEVAEDLRTHRADHRFVVITWYWRAQHYGMHWITFSTPEAAVKHRDSMFRIDLVYSDIRA